MVHVCLNSAVACPLWRLEFESPTLHWLDALSYDPGNLCPEQLALLESSKQFSCGECPLD